MAIIDGNVTGLQQRHHPKNIPHPVNLDQRLSAKDKTVSKYCKLSNILGDPGAVSRVDKMFVVKVYCKIETSPWALTLTEPVPEAFELPASDFFWPISEEKLPGDSRVFLHDVVFLIARYSCIARLTGKISRG